MISNLTKARILRSIIAGMTLAQAAAAQNISAARARMAVARMCEQLQLCSDIALIHAQPGIYLDALELFEQSPQFELRMPLVEKLEKLLALHSCWQLTPLSLAHVTASRLINAGLSVTAIADIQEWLLKHELSLRPCPPQTVLDFREAKKALALLDAYGFDTEALEWRMHELLRKRRAGPGG
ncbi:Uncharacterised protein [Delftia tsuruhatensis]|uniref:hypothetical protein n=1 Tax=Delftia tsuruhatensis TaxID=180282 RepID=UPI001E806EB7|nr:hypothetical protein [Delftia tsuruhatensis]CAB5721806.1 Uncharacterised protein [Delftia tsuruhatensis]CAC9680495.1 Uncharacterised protein [Delftia tsuruhatensis]